jgi:hypothetical protein
MDVKVFPKIAACDGDWKGDVSGAKVRCAEGWHVCLGNEEALKKVTFDEATAFKGCFAFDAAHDNNSCTNDCSAAVEEKKLDTAENIDMGGMGADCAWKYQTDASCLGSGRIDASENSGTGCNYHASLTGVICCAP